LVRQDSHLPGARGPACGQEAALLMKERESGMSDLSLSFESSGPKNAATIVFLNGGGAGSWMWRPVIKYLQDYYCLVSDQPEHGRNRAIAPFSMELAAEKTAELILQHARGGKACVVGLSEGAQIAVQLLATAPERVEKAVVSSALVLPIPGMGWATSRALLAWTYRLSIPPFKQSDWWIRLNMKYAAGIPVEYYSDFKKDFQEMTESEWINLITANQTFRLPAGLGKAAAPTLVLAGEKEYPAMKQSARDLVKALPHASGGFVNLGRNSSMTKEHNWALTVPEVFAQTVRAWIDARPLPEEIKSMN
jgi:pimeloyl-ACP methyl ester carboxylesterase